MAEQQAYRSTASMLTAFRVSDGEDVAIFHELNRLAAALASREAEIGRYKEALIKIASFGEGVNVGPHFDEPASAIEARAALNGGGT